MHVLLQLLIDHPIAGVIALLFTAFILDNAVGTAIVQVKHRRTLRPSRTVVGTGTRDDGSKPAA